MNETQSVVDNPKDADHCLLIDVSNLAYRSLFAYDLATADGSPSGHVYGSVKLLLSTLKNDLTPGKWCLIFCYDGIRAKEDRLKILPTYKEGRTKKFNPLPDVRDVLRSVPGLHVESDVREGDDAIAWMTEVLTKKTGADITILTGDKDMWALTRFDGVKILSPNKKRFITQADIEKEYHVKDPGKIHLFKSFFRDASDNIEGVKFLKKASLAPYINMEDVKTPEDVYKKLVDSEWNGFSVKTRFKIEDAKGIVIKNFQVVCPMMDCFGKESVHKTSISEEAKKSLYSKLMKFECRDLAVKTDYLFGGEQYVANNEP